MLPDLEDFKPSGDAIGPWVARSTGASSKRMVSGPRETNSNWSPPPMCMYIY